jgi:UrcA family protein
MIRLVLPTALAIAAIAGAAQAQAAGPFAYGSDSSNHQIVHYGDLDTSTSVGSQRLAFRIRVAARQLCGDSPITRIGRGFDTCVKSTVEVAAARLNQPMVTAALGLARSGSDYAGR